jgi:hypothetical protein
MLSEFFATIKNYGFRRFHLFSGLLLGPPERRLERGSPIGPQPDPASRSHRHVHGRHHLLLYLH